MSRAMLAAWGLALLATTTLPPAWKKTSTGERMPNVLAALRTSRAGH